MSQTACDAGQILGSLNTVELEQVPGTQLKYRICLAIQAHTTASLKKVSFQDGKYLMHKFSCRLLNEVVALIGISKIIHNHISRYHNKKT